ncbi:ATP-dependent DNA helicase [Rothia sp. (in: high G+C Gram-positive bacteria)]|uniref:ATP-dependent DNA helicase n=1 Tax=Rothia sp. (in: high G+C Gram-positive bacteria) TaxID=1885016 RepID=UPI000EEF2C31|nr:ATP-dependent helicase [Rothia sp. (in: high G+C Gram-positive bacteria)]
MSETVSAPTGQELETLPGAKPALELLDTVVERSGGQKRDGQRTMAAHVARSLETEKHLLVQAGTGTGKSLGYLVPAIVSAQHSEKPIIVATATLALQSQIVHRDIPRLLEALGDQPEHETDVAILKGRNNYACLHKVEGGYPEDDGDTLFEMDAATGATGKLGEEILRLRSWVQTTDTGDRDELLPGVSDRAWRQVSVTASECLGRKCPLIEECFSENARAQAADADIVITNHALLAINAFEGVNVLPEHEVVIIDEAHELADRVTGAVTGGLSPLMVSKVARSVRKHTTADHKALEQAALKLDDALNGVPAELMARGLPDRVAAAMEQVRDAARSALTDTKSGEKDADAGRQMTRASLTEVHDTAEKMLQADPQHQVIWVSRQGSWEPGRGYVAASDDDPATLNIAPISVAGYLREGLFDGRTVVLTSATLALGESFEATAGALGLMGSGAPRWDAIDVGSPFNYPKQGVLYLASDLPKPGRGVSTEQLDRIVELVVASGGGALGLFSSKRGAELAAEYVRERTDLNILLQGESSLRALVKEFVEDTNSCLFGTMSLWQGVDAPGDSCRLVIMDRIPFPRPDDPLSQARSRAVAQNGGNGFMAVSATHAAVRMAQGAGRLVRSVNDRGVVAVLDSRIATQRYGSYLVKTLPPFWVTQNKDVVLGALERLAHTVETH